MFNNKLADLWIPSPHKSKIFVGSHNIECNGGIREARYRCTQSGRFDGKHLFGSTGTKTYTNSVMQILKNAGLIPADCPPCPQFQYQTRGRHSRQCNSWEQDRDSRRKKESSKSAQNRFSNSNTRSDNDAKHKDVYSVPTQNRFSGIPSQQSGN